MGSKLNGLVKFLEKQKNKPESRSISEGRALRNERRKLREMNGEAKKRPSRWLPRVKPTPSR